MNTQTYTMNCMNYMNYCISFTGETHTVMYVCCRDGKKKDHNGPSKTRKKQKHAISRKIEKYCMARIIATEYLKTGNVHVRYTCTYTNHDLGLEECRYLPLPQSVRKDIQQQFATGVSDNIDSKDRPVFLCTF